MMSQDLDQKGNYEFSECTKRSFFREQQTQFDIIRIGNLIT